MNWRKIVKILAGAFIVIGCLFAFLVWEGICFITNPIESKYPVKGIDVSHYQGEIKWASIQKDLGISFAFIKATEGSSHIDEKFEENWEKATGSGLYIGAYHFFSFDSDGKRQAKNFISHVPKKKNMLPPVVDVEYYGKKANNPPKVKVVRKELDDLLFELEKEYNCKPIIYTTISVYQKYINEYYNSYPLWIRNVYYRPFLMKNRQWTFWQYSEKGNWPYGKTKTEKYVDMNVFAGSMDGFLRYFNLE